MSQAALNLHTAPPDAGDDLHNALNDPHGGHDGEVAHHFVNASQQKEAATLGMWAFLATEVMFFGGVFVAVTVYRMLHFDEFLTASKHLYWWIGGINTGVLLGSSLAVAIAVHAAHHGNRRTLILSLIATIVLGGAFIAIKGAEYALDFHENLVPNSPVFGIEPKLLAGHTVDEIQKDWRLHADLLKESGWPDRYAAKHDFKSAYELDQFIHKSEMFFIFYYTMTGIHATHMVIGLAIFVILLLQTTRGRYDKGRDVNPVECSGLYWHFVDIVWIFLYPLLYLIR